MSIRKRIGVKYTEITVTTSFKSTIRENAKHGIPR